jgi:hypothetical protein
MRTNEEHISEKKNSKVHMRGEIYNLETNKFVSLIITQPARRLKDLWSIR